MVKGIEKFQEFFRDYTDSYIIIGGTACDIIEESAGFNPRATKDIDIILIVEALSREFGEQFWRFIQAGNYTTRQKSNGENEYYRFIKPRDIEFPVQIELFSKKPDIILFDETSSFTPIPLDEDLSSLSAILMSEDYYNFTLEHSFIFSSIRMANIESLICLKAKAFIDLTARKNKGYIIDNKNINKHKNDIFRLASITSDETFVLPENIKKDLKAFCLLVLNQGLPDINLFKEMGIPIRSSKEVFDRLLQSFQITIDTNYNL